MSKPVSELEFDLEDENELDEASSEPLIKYEKAQRELVLQTVEFQIKNIAEMVNTWSLALNISTRIASDTPAFQDK